MPIKIRMAVWQRKVAVCIIGMITAGVYGCMGAAGPVWYSLSVWQPNGLDIEWGLIKTSFLFPFLMSIARFLWNNWQMFFPEEMLDEIEEGIALGRGIPVQARLPAPPEVATPNPLANNAGPESSQKERQ